MQFGDARLRPVQYVEDDKTRVFLQGLQLVDVRTQLLAVDRMREGATDDYALVRDAWMQRRQYQIFGERRSETDASLPDYLEVDHNKMTATFVRTPGLGDIPYAVQMEPNLVVEFYAKN